ncbi:hypothetical protein BEN49_00525 [Hymenobacter coccineus]|uniref:Uncharacterized protein n=1 Tax=Hymenobacter coccineus TaxID=1908235 RepID=A0A1G1TIW1_9BACT|nr:hypothetical protein BEN49_00525 [Hymenobacter coccineus]
MPEAATWPTARNSVTLPARRFTTNWLLLCSEAVAQAKLVPVAVWRPVKSVSTTGRGAGTNTTGSTACGSSAKVL